MKRLLPILLFALGAARASAEVPEALVRAKKKTVVNIEISVVHGLGMQAPGIAAGTGFIVDAKEGIVATNKHVAGISPSQVKITFENGESTDAKELYYDAWHDFAFYKLDPKKLGFKLEQAAFGSSFKLKEQDEVFLIGNNDVAEYSVKFGRVTNLWEDKGDRHSATFQTSFDRTGGSSGSPVMNKRGEVVGIHYKGGPTTSFEMRIEYLVDALKQIQEDTRVHRGDVGIELDLIHVSDAEKHFHLPAAAAAKIQALRKDLKRIIYVERVIKESPAVGLVKPGDIVVGVEGETPGDDLYLFDKVVDENVGATLTLAVYRNGEELKIPLKVEDAEAAKTRRFALFAGGVVHDLTPELRRAFEIAGPGVFLAQAERGTSFSRLGMGSRGSPTSYASVIEEVNGVPTPDLKSFIEAVRPLRHDQKIYVLLANKRSYRSSTGAQKVTLDIKVQPLRVLKHNDDTLDWDEEK